jgi:hypothetical protein
LLADHACQTIKVDTKRERYSYGVSQQAPSSLFSYKHPHLGTEIWRSGYNITTLYV